MRVALNVKGLAHRETPGDLDLGEQDVPTLPEVERIAQNCSAMDAFARARPALVPGAPLH